MSYPQKKCARPQLALMLCVIFVLHCGVSQAVITGNLVLNGDAETGNLTDWLTTNGMEVISDPGATVRGTLGLTSGVGTYSFYGGTGATPATATQLVDLIPFALDIDAGNQAFELEVVLQSRSAVSPPNVLTDLAIARFTFLNASSAVLGSPLVFTDPPSFNVFPWTEFSQQGLVPVSARFLEIEIESNRDGGSSSDAYIDNVSFALVPEPSSFILFFLAGLAFAVERRHLFTH